MPLLQPPRQLIELPVSPRTFGDLSLPQKACFKSLTHTQNAVGECQAAIVVAVTLYAPGATPDEYGPLLTGVGFAPREETLLADNNTLVEAATGNILAIRGWEDNDAWHAKPDDYPQATMWQGDFFEQMRETQAVRIGDMIRLYIQQADEAGKFQ